MTGLDGHTLERLRAELERHRVHLRDEIEQQGADPETDELIFADERGFSDRSHDTEERSQLISLVEALRSNLVEVERALEEMSAGTYGACERCGVAIAMERLEAIPWASLCIDCKREAAR